MLKKTIMVSKYFYCLPMLRSSSLSLSSVRSRRLTESTETKIRPRFFAAEAWGSLDQSDFGLSVYWHRQSASRIEGTQPIWDSFTLMHLVASYFCSIVRLRVDHFLLLQRLLTPRDRIELLISFSRSEARSEAPSVVSFWSCRHKRLLSASVNNWRLNTKPHFAISEPLSEILVREQEKRVQTNQKRKSPTSTGSGHWSILTESASKIA